MASGQRSSALSVRRTVRRRMAISRHDKNKDPSVSGPRGLCARTFDQLCSVTRLDYSDGMVNEELMGAWLHGSRRAQKKAPGEAGAVKYKGHSDRGEDVKPVLHP